jgi:presenilin-like A22 family membrane protease
MKIHWRHFLTFSFWFELFCFAFSIYLSIGIALRLAVKYTISPTASQSELLSAIQFIGLFLVATVILILLLKYFKKPWLMQVLFYLAVLEGIWVFSQAYFNWPNNLFFIAIVLLLWALYRNVFIHNLIIIIAISAIAVIFGSNIAPSTGILVLLFIAVYDYWAVYKTTHMVKMFKGLAESKVYFTLIIPHTFRDLFKKMQFVSPQIDFMFLGTGDIALPLIFIISCLKINLLTALITALGTIAGFIFLYVIFISQEERKPMPGLPPIVLGTFIGFLISQLFFRL